MWGRINYLYFEVDYDKKLLAFFCVLVLCISLSSALPIHGEEEIYSNVIRFHCIANSDENFDQGLKLKVRDDVVSFVGELVFGIDNIDEAIETVEKNLDKIREVAENRVQLEGYSYSVNCYLSDEIYPRKEYENMCFPKGKYRSLRVVIGEGQGQNYWCVLFPSLCLSTATEKSDRENAFINVGLDAEQYKIITETDNTKYKLRFRILEIIEELK